jgi:hypothetical protein
MLLPATLAWLGLLASCGRQAAALAPGEVRLACESPRHHFGRVFAGALLEHAFELSVEGSSDLIVVDVRNDCGCTLARFERLDPRGAALGEVVHGQPLPSGSRLRLSVRYDTTGKRGSTPRAVRIFCNEADGVSELWVEAQVDAWLTCEPELVTLPPMSDRDSARVTFQVRGTTATPFRLRAAGTAIPPEIRVSCTPVASELEAETSRARAWVVDVDLGRGLARGSQAWPIRLLSDVENPLGARDADGRPASFAVQPTIAVQVVGSAYLEPPALAFGVLDPAETVSRSLRVIGLDPARPLSEPRARLAGLRAGDGASELAQVARVVARPVPGRDAWDVELVLPGIPPAVGATFLGRLVIETGHPDEPRLEATVSGFVRGRSRAPGSPPGADPRGAQPEPPR